jgi:hypothetical protein
MSLYDFARINQIGLLFLLSILRGYTQNIITISGTVKEKGSKEVLIGASIATSDFSKATATNAYGVYSLSLPKGNDSIRLSVSFMGFNQQNMAISAHADLRLDIELEQETETLQTVEVKATPQYLTDKNSGLSSISLPIKMLKQLPVLLGEKDPLKVLQLMPGVSNPREGFSGIFVRGGDPGQNLFLLDDAIVYNAYHLFGFFSVFNGDALRHIELYKAGFPARYGGRASAVLDLRMKEGNKESFHGEGGIGLIASRLTLEGPIIKNKMSYVFSGRRTYADLLWKPFQDKGDQSSIYFYDANGKINWQVTDKDNISVSGYFGNDYFNFGSEKDAVKKTDGFDWGNATATLRWNRIVNKKLFSNLTMTFSDFKFKVYSEQSIKDTLTSLEYYSGIQDFSAKWDLDYIPSVSHHFRVGLQAFKHRFENAAFVVKDTRLNINQLDVKPINAFEGAVYIEDAYQPTSNLTINGGLRVANFQVNGKSYFEFEPRLNANFSLNERTNLQASYSRMNQFLHLLSNSSAGLPTDLWVPATDKVAPQQTDQWALGISHELKECKSKLTIETYYKKLKQIIGYKEGASFLILDIGPNPNAIKQVSFEDNITTGKAYSYGLETMFQFQGVRLQGWLSYTLSWTKQQLDGVNNDAFFWARHDRRHNLSLVGTYALSKKWKLSATWVYGSGAAVTIPVSEFDASVNNNGRIDSKKIKEYSERNGFRLPDYHRLDIALQYHKKKKWGEVYWELGFYNAYNRANAMYLKSGRDPNDAGKNIVYKVALFPIIPSISYNFKF